MSDYLTDRKDKAHGLVSPSYGTVRHPGGRLPAMARVNRDDMVRRLRAVREEMRLSRAALAERLGVGRTTYANWETETPAKPSFPSEEAMAELCAQVAGLTLDYLYTGRLGTMRTDLAIRLTAREMGIDPDAEQFDPGQIAAVVASKAA
jgi:transcriptional regulator with XRE-family HTH domain